jgi:hypothetical protein
MFITLGWAGLHVNDTKNRTRGAGRENSTAAPSQCGVEEAVLVVLAAGHAADVDIVGFIHQSGK